MWVVIKSRFDKRAPLTARGNIGKTELGISRVVDSLDKVEKGEVFFKCNIKN